MASSFSRKTLPIVLFGLGLILIALSFYFVLHAQSSQSPQTDLSAVPVKVSFPVPKLTLTDTQGVSHSLTDYRGQVVLVNLWATWCPPCKQEMPTLQTFYDKYKDQGFTIIAINDGDPKADVLKFVKDYQLTFPVWLDPTYIATDKAFNTQNLPTSFVIDRDQTIRLMWVGGINSKMLDKYLTPLISEQQ
jgi:peroxiredoxin